MPVTGINTGAEITAKRKTQRSRRKGQSINKSQAIRDKKRQLGHCRPVDIVNALEQDGISVSYGLVAGVLGRMTSKNGTGRRGRPAKRASDLQDMASLLAAKKLIETSGSLQEARAALDTLGKLLN